MSDEYNLELPAGGCANKKLSRDYNSIGLQQDLVWLC